MLGRNTRDVRLLRKDEGVLGLPAERDEYVGSSPAEWNGLFLAFRNWASRCISSSNTMPALQRKCWRSHPGSSETMDSRILQLGADQINGNATWERGRAWLWCWVGGFGSCLRVAFVSIGKMRTDRPGCWVWNYCSCWRYRAWIHRRHAKTEER